MLFLRLILPAIFKDQTLFRQSQSAQMLTELSLLLSVVITLTN